MREVPTRFTRYEFTEEEFIQACTLTSLNLAQINNLRAEAAEEKISLTYDPINPMKFVQREAELQGQIGILDLLIQQHEAALSQNLKLKLESSQQEK